VNRFECLGGALYLKHSQGLFKRIPAKLRFLIIVLVWKHKHIILAGFISTVLGNAAVEPTPKSLKSVATFSGSPATDL
jgi:hypothetical protein